MKNSSTRKLLNLTVLVCASVLFATAPAQGQQADAGSGNVQEQWQQMIHYNSLDSENLFAWHMRVHFTLAADASHPALSGSYEEFWGGPAKFRRTTIMDGFRQVDYGVAQGILRSGDKVDRAPQVEWMRRALKTPIRIPPATLKADVIVTEKTEKEEKLTCFGHSNFYPDEKYCLPEGSRELRKIEWKMLNVETLLSHPLAFQGHTVPGDIEIRQTGKTLLTAHVDTLENLDEIRELDFAPTPDATLLPAPKATPFHRRIMISAGVAVGLLQERHAPLYPAEAKVVSRVFRTFDLP